MHKVTQIKLKARLVAHRVAWKQIGPPVPQLPDRKYTCNFLGTKQL